MDDQRPVLAANAFLWNENARLRRELQRVREQLRLHQDNARQLRKVQRRCEQLRQSNQRLRQQVAELTGRLQASPSQPPQSPPPWVKPNTRRQRHKRPGQKPGHAPALRPQPRQADVHRQVPLSVDRDGKVSCPHCHTRLNNVRDHERWVEEIIPSKLLTTCYHTTSGYCPSCRKSVESRADEQPPAADLPHAQLGLNALSTAAMMRVGYRLPLRQIVSLLADLPGLKLSAAAISRQLLRLSRWLEGLYDHLKVQLRAAGVVHADETGWRIDGKNAQLWTLTNDNHTLFHVDKSRSGRVIAALLGRGFGADGNGTLVSDFYSAYNQFSGPQQKCLAHLLREIGDLVKQNPDLAKNPFFKRCRRLIKDMLKLGKRREELAGPVYEHQVALLEKRLEKLGEARWDQPDARRLARRLAKHRNHLTTFLHNPLVEPTNNRAERALRPAVVHRKITGGSRSQRGARAWAILASIMTTARQHNLNVLQTLQNLLKAHWAGRDPTLLSDLLLATPAGPSG